MSTAAKTGWTRGDDGAAGATRNPARGCGDTGRPVLPSRAPRPPVHGSLVLPVLPGALCKGQDPALWFPRPGGSMEEAKAVCRACPARILCLDWAVHELPRLFRTGNLRLNHAASCPFRYSSMTSCGVL